ncbi:LOW QUALITY PROTEIN: hypothetical protein DAPPUDRAFT_241839 [Daphnia pulex]|uniref:Uncharacterized protein n=1 Tax=Daphnia pulex TaxID=6669 RepID=E9GF73_DAPPU|nr:LOW QUALITY PROTEIN: hypothetical protein DAPPUDRAFT_241839 [Daphnia pulex]|eukprot:EFX81589.1 LOW QUALITY PROTEIN: hypothetical protein DAPPUDRAFT_241839 [Daphnia pulex]
MSYENIVKLILTAQESIEEVEATVPNVADTDQRSAGSGSLLATGKRLRESFTTHEENMDANSSPVAPKIRVNTARAASAMPKKGISTTESEEQITNQRRRFQQITKFRPRATIVKQPALLQQSNV